MTVVLIDQLVDAGADRANDAKLGQVRAEPGPEPVVGARIVDGAGVHLKPVPEEPHVDNPEGYARGSSAYQATIEGIQGQPATVRTSFTSLTPLAIHAASTTASCSAQVRT
jgi:hypothetical protein